MLDRDSRHALELPAEVGESDESWLTSYLDVLTLLITLFVLLLALTPSGGGEGSESSIMDPSNAVTSLPLASLATGILPRHDGLHPQMAGLDIPG
ncbi:MAG TPA: flagellar motor protein MotB, partial [Halomonas sp.]|nr:flagellar motor protein MotB [Halomonas sp.]